MKFIDSKESLQFEINQQIFRQSLKSHGRGNAVTLECSLTGDDSKIIQRNATLPLLHAEGSFNDLLITLQRPRSWGMVVGTGLSFSQIGMH